MPNRRYFIPELWLLWILKLLFEFNFKIASIRVALFGSEEKPKSAAP